MERDKRTIIRRKRAEQLREAGRKGGRPKEIGVLNSDRVSYNVIRLFLDFIAKGHNFSFSCDNAGVTQGAMRKEISANPLLLARVQKARAQAVDLLLSRITNASEKNWFAAAWILERTYPNSYGQRPKGGGGGNDKNITVKVVTNVTKVSGTSVKEIMTQQVPVKSAEQREEMDAMFEDL